MGFDFFFFLSSPLWQFAGFLGLQASESFPRVKSHLLPSTPACQPLPRVLHHPDVMSNQWRAAANPLAGSGCVMGDYAGGWRHRRTLCRIDPRIDFYF